MNNAIKSLVATIVITALSGPVMAQEYVQPDAGFVSTKTRAEVRAEIASARADGSMDVRETGQSARSEITVGRVYDKLHCC